MTTYLNGSRLVVFPGQDLYAGTGGLAKIMGQEVPAMGGDYPGLDNFIHTLDVAGIEVYARVTDAPGKYQLTNGNCGVILIWTK